MENPFAARDLSLLRSQYLAAKPFGHVVMDRFLSPDLLRRLQAEFPAFSPQNAVSENGVMEGKAVRSDLPEIGPAFRELHEIRKSPDFLASLEKITGIEGILFDPHYYGGGTHESLHGQELDPHIDFNLHPLEDWNRRINFLLYLNDDWREEYGGNLELFQNPPASREAAVRISPTANRCVVFGTNDQSWHGYDRVQLLQPNTSRKSIAVYFYTPLTEALERPRSTVYSDRPPAKNASVSALANHLERRRTHFLRILKEEKQHLKRLRQLNRMFEATCFALEKPQDPNELRCWIDNLDLRIKKAYDRESELRRLREEVSREVSILGFFTGESTLTPADSEDSMAELLVKIPKAYKTQKHSDKNT